MIKLENIKLPKYRWTKLCWYGYNICRSTADWHFTLIWQMLVWI